MVIIVRFILQSNDFYFMKKFLIDMSINDGWIKHDSFIVYFCPPKKSFLENFN